MLRIISYTPEVGHHLIGKAVTDRQSCVHSICALAVITADCTLSVSVCISVCLKKSVSSNFAGNGLCRFFEYWISHEDIAPSFSAATAFNEAGFSVGSAPVRRNSPAGLKTICVVEDG